MSAYNVNANCQRCRQPLIPQSLPAFPPPPSGAGTRHPHRQQQQQQGPLAPIQDSIAALSPSAYDFLSASDRFPSSAAAASSSSGAAPPSPTRSTAHDATPTALADPNATRRYQRAYPQMYGVATRTQAVPGSSTPGANRLVVPRPTAHTGHVQPRRPLGPQESFVVLTDSVLQPGTSALGSAAPSRPTAGSGQPYGQTTTFTGPDGAHTTAANQGDARDAQDGSAVGGPHGGGGGGGGGSLESHLAQLSALYALLSSPPASASTAAVSSPTAKTTGLGSGGGGGGTGLPHPLCTECTELLFELMTRELDALKKERERLLGFEKEVIKRREEATKALLGDKAPNGAAAAAAANGVELKEALERDIVKLKKAEAHAIAELKSVEAQKAALVADKEALDAEEAELAEQEAEFWKDHCKYVLRRDEMQDRESALKTRLANGRKELDKLQRTNVYNDAFCIGQEAGFGTINGLRLGRLPGVNVDWPEINAAWGHTLLLLSTIAHKFGFRHFRGYRLVPCGSFSTIEKLEEGAEEAMGLSGRGGEEKGAVVAVYELYGSGDFAVTRLLQNRRFDMAMVAFLECLRQLVEFVTARDPKVRVPHAVVKDRIGDVSIKLQFGSDEAWTRALRHVLLDLKILLSRASL